jgi:hypothetical protein
VTTQRPETVWTVKLAAVSWTRPKKRKGKTTVRMRLYKPKTMRPVPEGHAYQRRVRARRKRR